MPTANAISRRAYSAEYGTILAFLSLLTQISPPENELINCTAYK